MATTEQIIIEYSGDIKKLKKSNQELKKQYQDMSKQLDKNNNKQQQGNEQQTKSFAKLIAKIAATIAIFKGLFNVAMKAQQSQARLDAVLRATGGAAGITQKQMKGLTKSLQDYTGETKSVVQDTQAVLLTFKNISGGTFDRAQKAVADISAVLGTDLRSAALQVGKALEDPVLGMTALNRSGVSFSASQKQVIKDLVATGKAAEAQGMLLKAIEEQVGGAALALNNTDTGKFQTAMNGMTDAAAKLGQIFLPILSDVASAVSSVVSVFTSLPKSVQTVGIALVALGALAVTFGNTFTVAMGPVGIFVASVVALVSLMTLFRDTTKSFAEIDKDISTIANSTGKFTKELDGLNKSIDDTVKGLSGLKKGSSAYEKEVQKLLKSLPKLAEYGITTASSIEQIKDAQAKLNAEMKADNVINAEKNFNKLSDSVVDLKVRLGEALTEWQNDPTAANQAKFEKALITYQKMTDQIKINGKLAGKSQDEIADVVAQTSLKVKAYWADANVSLEQISKNSVSNIQKYFEQLGSNLKNGVLKDIYDSWDKIIKLTRKLQKGSKPAKKATVSTTGSGVSSFADNEKAIQALQQEIALQQKLNALQSAGATDLDIALTKVNDKYSMLIDEVENSNKIGGTQLAEKITALRKKQELEIKKLKDKNLKDNEKAEIQSSKDIAEKQKQIEQAKLQNALTTLSLVKSVVDIISDTASTTDEKVINMTQSVVSQFGVAGQIASGILDVGKGLSAIFDKPPVKWIEEYTEQVQAITQELQDGLDAVSARQSVGGSFDIEALTLDVKEKDTFANDLFKTLGIQPRTEEEMIAIQNTVNGYDLDFSEYKDKIGEQILSPLGYITKEKLNAVLDDDTIRERFEGIIPTDLMDVFLENFSGSSTDQILQGMGDFFEQLGGEGANKAINALTDLSEAQALLLTATQKTALAELEHRKNIGEFENDDAAYNEAKLEILDSQIEELEKFLELNGDNAAIQEELWALEESRYSTQQAITDELDDQLSALKKIDDQMLNNLIAEKEQIEAQIATGAIREDASTVARLDALNQAIVGRLGQLGYSDLAQESAVTAADYLRDQLGDSMFSALSGTGQAVTFPSTQQPIVNVASPVNNSASNVTYKIDGVNFTQPADLLLYLNNQSRNTTGRPIL